jgi:transcription initiation factor TFIID subunit 12
MQDIADDFVENVAAFACELAVHRGGTTLEAKDIQLALGTHSGLLS